MSVVTDIILVTAMNDGAQGEDRYDSVDRLNALLSEIRQGRPDTLVKVDQHAGGTKAMQCDVWMAAINMLDEDAFVMAFLSIDWGDPECAQLMLKSEDDCRFRVINAEP